MNIPPSAITPAWPAERILELRQRLLNGETVASIGLKLGLRREAVDQKMQRLRALGYPLIGRAVGGRPGIDWTPEMDSRLRMMRENRETWAAIADAFGLGRNTVLERGRKIGAKRGEAAVIVEAAPAPNYASAFRDPLPPGDPLAWSIITAGTCLAGTRYPHHQPLGSRADVHA